MNSEPRRTSGDLELENAVEHHCQSFFAAAYRSRSIEVPPIGTVTLGTVHGSSVDYTYVEVAGQPLLAKLPQILATELAYGDTAEFIVRGEDLGGQLLLGLAHPTEDDLVAIKNTGTLSLAYVLSVEPWLGMKVKFFGHECFIPAGQVESIGGHLVNTFVPVKIVIIDVDGHPYVSHAEAMKDARQASLRALAEVTGMDVRAVVRRIDRHGVCVDLGQGVTAMLSEAEAKDYIKMLRINQSIFVTVVSVNEEKKAVEVSFSEAQRREWLSALVVGETIKGKVIKWLYEPGDRSHSRNPYGLLIQFGPHVGLLHRNELGWRNGQRESWPAVGETTQVLVLSVDLYDEKPKIRLSRKAVLVHEQLQQ